MSTNAIPIVLLAAGAARRYGSCKLAQEFRGVPILRRSAQSALGASDRVVVVVGAHRQILEPLLADLPVRVVFNPRWNSGMGESIACGVRALCDSALRPAAVVIGLADQVRLTGASYRALLDRFHNEGADLIAATYGTIRGPPCLFGETYFDELMRLSGPGGARSVIERHVPRLTRIALPEAEFDIDEPSDLPQRGWP